MWLKTLKENNKKFHFHLELTSKCNAACPHCPRFLKGLPVREPSLNLYEMNLAAVKKWFPKDTLESVGSMNICGNFGDPSVCKDMIEIVDYFHKTNPETNIQIRTNGGARNASFWEKLGKLSYKSNWKIVVIFSVDGLEDTNHIYRRRVKWKNLVRNIKAFTYVGGYAAWEYLIFKHNEHQIEEAKELKEHFRMDYISFKRPLGFENYFHQKTQPLPVYNKEGELEYFLEPAEKWKNSDLPWDGDTSEIPEKVNNFTDSCHIDFSKLDYSNYKEVENRNISCKAYHSDKDEVEVYINSNGDVRPCCHTGTELDRNNQGVEGRQLKKILSPQEKFNLGTNKFENIMKLLDNRFVKKWDKSHSKGRCVKCSLMCGQSSAVDSNRLYADINKITETI